MLPADQLTLDLLVPLLAPTTGVEELQHWWTADRNPAEPLATFLARMGILTPAAVQTLPLASRGYLQLTAESVLTPDGRTRLLRRCRQASQPREVALQSTTRIAADQVGTFANIELPPPRPRAPGAERPTAHAPDSTLNVQLSPEVGPARVGARLGRCLLTRILGEGGGGVVYQALHQSLGISVAVKVLRKRKNDHALRTALRTEARLLAQLNHPHVVRVLDFDDEAPQPYLVMEFVDGYSLADLIAQCGHLRPALAAELLMQAVGGLEAAQELGITHRDVKPANILIGRDGVVKIADLGLASCTGATPDAPGGCGGGTATYMAPECFSDAPVDYRADIYALGITLYEALVGQPPFLGSNPLELMIEHANTPLPDLHRRRPEVTPAAARLVEQMTAKRPEDRPTDYARLLTDLALAFAVHPEAAQPWRSPAKRTQSRSGLTASGVVSISALRSR